MAFTDGNTIAPMVTSQDYKRVRDGNEGPNTGGMGAYSPARVMTPELEQEIMERIMLPTICGLKKENIMYKGILYAGIMVKEGKPWVLEFNCRFGDPETQAVLMRLDTDLLDIFMAINDGTLGKLEVKWKEGASMCVVMASEGYPGKFVKGKAVTGLDTLKGYGDTEVFHSGTGFDHKGIVTSGGRVLAVTSIGRNLRDAKKRAYDAVEKIHFDNKVYRKDIGDVIVPRVTHNCGTIPVFPKEYK
ncbi:phosphoribosylamine--glycine ligase [Candidatus Omnitrophus magneticus]|uniref:phosphoribosylamine--glycine ligase n=1 Tax=Candidatus Omnitrophus magneticus TaxID=1609969 RepID=A0A0F0CPU7_9BACT|nr:phosphoribosylamine--glycine ligase [Candidatus Omnitrophus magneticus]